MKFKVGEIIYIWDNDETPYGTLDSGGKRYNDQRVFAPSSYKVTGRTMSTPTKIQIRKLDEVVGNLLNNPNYSYWVKEDDVQVIGR